MASYVFNLPMIPKSTFFATMRKIIEESGVIKLQAATMAFCPHHQCIEYAIRVNNETPQQLIQEIGKTLALTGNCIIEMFMLPEDEDLPLGEFEDMLYRECSGEAEERPASGRMN